MPASLTPDPVRVVKYIFANNAEREAHVVTAGDVGIVGAVCFQTNLKRYFIAFRAGASLENWRLIDNEGISNSFTNTNTINVEAADGFIDLIIPPIISADRTQLMNCTAQLSVDNIATTATVRLRDVTNSINLTTRNFVFTPNKVSDVVIAGLNATIQLTVNPPPPIDVRYQCSVAGPGMATLTDMLIVLSLRLIPS